MTVIYGKRCRSEPDRRRCVYCGRFVSVGALELPPGAAHPDCQLEAVLATFWLMDHRVEAKSEIVGIVAQG